MEIVRFECATDQRPELDEILIGISVVDDTHSRDRLWSVQFLKVNSLS